MNATVDAPRVAMSPPLFAAVAAVLALSLSSGCFLLPGADGEGGGSGEEADRGPAGAELPEIDCSKPETFNGTLDSDTTLESGSCYTVSETVELEKGVLLTIEPGTLIRFEAGTGLRVDRGKLHAEGTADQPIGFTSVEETPGSWEGIRFHSSNSEDNVLAHVVVEYASDANLFLRDNNGPVRIEISNSTFRNGSGWGIESDANNTPHEFDTFAHNVVTGNEHGAKFSANDVGELDASNSFAGNEERDLVISRNVTDDQTWPGFDANYTVAGDIDVSGAALEIEPGATLQFENGHRLRIRPDASLNAEGTSDNRVTFTGNKEVSGSWGGLQFHSSNNPNNVLKHVNVRYASDANLFLRDNNGPVRLSIQQSKFTDAAGWGIETDTNNESHEFPKLANNVVRNNERGAKFDANDVGEIAASNGFTGNENVDLQIDGTVAEDQSWPGLDADYTVAGRVEVRGADLTVEPGATFVVEKNEGFRIQNDAALIAEGTSDKPIEFTGSEQIEGHWNGVQFFSSKNNRNALDHVTVEFAGNQHDGNLYLRDNNGPSRVTIQNSTFRKSSGWGIFVDDNNEESELKGCSGNSYEDNAEAAIGAKSGSYEC